MSIFLHPSYDCHEGVHAFQDEVSGLRGIIAIHSTRLGPAAGGCRVWNYATEEQALDDALRLSRGMTYKNALAGLKAGGGKAVIMAPPGGCFDRSQLFEAFGRAVESLGGQYITAEDVGSTVQDMEIVASQTCYVAGLPPDGPSSAGGDPSPWTALGVFLALEAAVRYKLDRSLEGVRVAVQGLGNVGYHLCQHLHDAGASLIVSDLSEQRLAVARERFQAVIETIDRIHQTDVDVFAPCAMGSVFDARTIPEMRAKVVCGGANNQLGDGTSGALLRSRDVLYCPDYVVNAGGIINVMAEFAGRDASEVREQIEQIPARLLAILLRADHHHMPTNDVADTLAQEMTGRDSMTPLATKGLPIRHGIEPRCF
jgi:leucine dehydrogenase